MLELVVMMGIGLAAWSILWLLTVRLERWLLDEVDDGED